MESLILSEGIEVCKRRDEKRAQIGKYLDALVRRGDRVFNLCRQCPVVIEDNCLEDESEVILAPGGVSRLDFVFRPDNRTLSKTILAREAKVCHSEEKQIRRTQSTWTTFAWILLYRVLLAAVIILVGFFVDERMDPMDVLISTMIETYLNFFSVWRSLIGGKEVDVLLHTDCTTA